MQRRQFIKKSTLTIGTSALMPNPNVFSQILGTHFKLETLSAKSISEFWFLLLSYYQKNLSASKAWFTAPGPQLTWGGKEDPEGPLRMMFAFGGWFSDYHRASVVEYKGAKIDIEDLFISTIINGTHPNRKGSWDFNNESAWIYPVDAGNVGWALWLTGDRFNDVLDNDQRQQIANWLNEVDYKERYNNWVLFDAMRLTSLKSLGMPFDSQLLQERLTFTETLYRDEGWYSDQSKEYVYDDYNNWVFHSHLMYIMIMGGREKDLRFAVWRERTQEFLTKQIYLYGADGSHPHYGRSQLYKFARLVSLILGYKLGLTSMPVGQLRRLIRIHLNYYLGNGAVNSETGRIEQKLSGKASYAVREYYSSPGSVYWCAMTIGALFLLDDNDSLFSAEEVPLPIESENYDILQKVPDWVVHGEKETGHTILYRTGPHKRNKNTLSGDSDLHYASKYRRFAYHSHLGYCVGRSCDNLPYLRLDNEEGSERYLPVHVDSEIGMMGNIPVLKGIMEYRLDGFKVLFSTVLIVYGETHLRFHKVVSVTSGKQIYLDEGGYALGRSEFDKTRMAHKEKMASVNNKNGMSFIYGLSGFDQFFASPFGYEGKQAIHTFQRYNALPYATSSKPIADNEVFGLLVKGSKKHFSTEKIINSLKNVKIDDSKVSVEFSKGDKIEVSFMINNSQA